MEASALKSMKKKRRNLLLILVTALMAVIAAGVLCACSAANDEDQIIDRGWVHEVVYDANGGSFDPSIPTQYNYVRVQENSLTVEPGYTPAGAGALDIISVPTRSGYDLLGWKQVLFDAEGNETGTAEEYWDFKTDRVTGDITLRAEWAQRGEVVINLSIGGELVPLETTYRVSFGASFLSMLYDPDAYGNSVVREDYVRSRVRTQTIGDQTYTLLSFYLDEEMTEPLTVENAVYPENGEAQFNLYARYLVGNFTVLSQDTLSSSTRLMSNSNWYLVSDVDFSNRNGEPAEWDALTSFTGTIYGNGHTITGVDFRTRVRARELTRVRSIFGVMSGTVEDLVFEEVSLTVWSGWFDDTSDPKPEITVAFLAGSFDGGVFRDVALEGCTIRTINAEREDEAQRGFYCILADDNWIDGAGSEESTVTGKAEYTGNTSDNMLGL